MLIFPSPHYSQAIPSHSVTAVRCCWPDARRHAAAIRNAAGVRQRPQQQQQHQQQCHQQQHQRHQCADRKVVTAKPAATRRTHNNNSRRRSIVGDGGGTLSGRDTGHIERGLDRAHGQRWTALLLQVSLAARRSKSWEGTGASGWPQRQRARSPNGFYGWLLLLVCVRK